MIWHTKSPIYQILGNLFKRELFIESALQDFFEIEKTDAKKIWNLYSVTFSQLNQAYFHFLCGVDQIHED